MGFYRVGKSGEARGLSLRVADWLFPGPVFVPRAWDASPSTVAVLLPQERTNSAVDTRELVLPGTWVDREVARRKVYCAAWTGASGWFSDLECEQAGFRGGSARGGRPLPAGAWSPPLREDQRSPGHPFAWPARPHRTPAEIYIHSNGKNKHPTAPGRPGIVPVFPRDRGVSGFGVHPQRLETQGGHGS